jgi:hypothetical protein
MQPLPPKNAKKSSLGMVAHSCNSSYLRGRDEKGGRSRPGQAKCWQDSFSINSPIMMVCTCGPSYKRGHDERIRVYTTIPCKKATCYLKKLIKSKKWLGMWHKW